MRQKLIAGNWKMNGLSDEGLRLAEGIVDRRLRAMEYGNESGRSCELLICPPFTLLSQIRPILGGTGIALGAQDCHPETSGAHTGDISAGMLGDVGCECVIVGHSERRQNHGESDALVRAKANAALQAGLAPIVCIGETDSQREQGQTQDVLRSQMEGSLPEMKGRDATSLVIAYEPVWAIGTGKSAAVQDIIDAHEGIRSYLAERFGSDLAQRVRVLYGGSVKPENAVDLLSLDNVDGALVGGASLKVEDFWAIATSCP